MYASAEGGAQGLRQSDALPLNKPNIALLDTEMLPTHWTPFPRIVYDQMQTKMAKSPKQAKHLERPKMRHHHTVTSSGYLKSMTRGAQSCQGVRTKVSAPLLDLIRHMP